MKTKHSRPLRRRITGGIAWGAVLAASLLFASPAISNDLGELAQRLMTLRGEVEQLSADLDESKARTRDQLRSLARQKADLESQVQREKLRIKQLRQTLDTQRERLAATSELGDNLSPIVRRAIGNLKEAVAGGMPFKNHERLGELKELEDKLANGTLEPGKALARLWAFVEDELRLTRESGLYRQTIALDGKEMLADVARVGMVMLFFKTADDRTGIAVPGRASWEYTVTDDPDTRDRILQFFDSLKKQIRQGYFTLPFRRPGTTEVQP